MKESETLFVSERKEWRNWLEANYDEKKEIWLIYPKKNSGKPRILYNDAVEEALCFGWIDSIVKSVDDENTAQRFSPRKSKSNYSQANKERLKWLAKEKLLRPSILDEVEEVLKEEFIFPDDILKAIRKDRIAWAHYVKCSGPYKRIRIAYIDAARKRPEEFKKRLANFIKKTRGNKRIGYGGIEKYY